MLLTVLPAAADTLTIPNSFTDGTTASATQVNANFTAISTVVNGNIANANIKSAAAISLSKLDLTTELFVLRAAANRCISAGTTGDTVPRVGLNSDGQVFFGAGGASATDLLFKRTDANTLAVRNAADDTDKNLTVGALTASGNVAGVNGTFSGPVSGTTGTFSGAAQATALTLTTTPLTPANGGSGNNVAATLGTILVGDGTKFAPIGPGSNGQVPTSNGTTLVMAAPSAGGIVNNLRLTLSSSNPDTDTSAASTIYALPYNGNSISIYNGSTWDLLTTSSASIAVPATQYFRLYNVYCYNNASTPTLELDAWDSGGQTTKTITAATAANPCVITTSTAHGLSVGDLIGIRKGTGTGTGWTDTAMGLDQKVFRVSAVPLTTTIQLEGCDASALTFSTFTGTPTVYKIPTSPTTAPVRQDGVWCKTGTLTRRFLGTFMTNGGGTVDDSTSARLVSNVDNRAPAILSSEDTTSSYTTAATSTFYPRTNSIALGITRVHMVNALAKPMPLHVTNASNGTTDGFAISRNNCTPATLANWPSSFLGAASCGYYNYSGSFDVNPSVPAGFSFFQQFNYGNGAAHMGSANATNTAMCRITAEVER